MNIKDYSTLKSGSKVSFAKATVNGEEVIQLTEKRFDYATGEALDDRVVDVQLHDYKSEKSNLESKKSIIESQITELEKIITDIEAL